MNDKKWIVLGLAIFMGLFSFPLWYTWVVKVGKAAPAPELVLTEKAKAAGKCIMSKDYMTAEHMQLLDQWRHNVVRNAQREFVNEEGKSFNMSLSNTCLDCHSNKAEFCDRCHDYAAVQVYCWDCHIDNPQVAGETPKTMSDTSEAEDEDTEAEDEEAEAEDEDAEADEDDNPKGDE